MKIRELRRFEADQSLVSKDVILRPLPGRQTEAMELGIPPQGLEYTEQVAVFTLQELDDMAAAEGLFRWLPAVDMKARIWVREAVGFLFTKKTKR